jgi:hypothetical protein
MCFNAAASLIAGGALAATGVATIKLAKDKTEVPFAVIPLAFGVQQLIEGGVWLSFAKPALNDALAHGFLFFSHVFWPIWIPFAVLMMERHLNARRMLFACMVGGAVLAGYMFHLMWGQPVNCEIINHSIGYQIANNYIVPTAVLYLLATVGALMLSTRKYIKIIGLIVLILAVIAQLFYSFALSRFGVSSEQLQA